MSKTIVIGSICALAIIAGMVYVIDDARAPVAVNEPGIDKRAPSASAPPQGSMQETAGSRNDPVRHPTRASSGAMPADPRLAALMVSPQSELIDFVVGDGGNVIKEIDLDPGSLGFKKPAREYSYSNGKVVGLTSYHYLGDHVEITKIAVSYKPDGSVDQYLESTSTEPADKLERHR